MWLAMRKRVSVTRGDCARRGRGWARRLAIVAACAASGGIASASAVAEPSSNATVAAAKNHAAAAAHPLCTAFVSASAVASITGVKTVPDRTGNGQAAQTALGGQWLDWRANPTARVHNLPGSLCQYLTTSAPWAGDYENDGWVSVVWGASAKYWKGLRAYAKSADEAVNVWHARYMSMGPNEYIDAVNLPANGYGPYPGIPQFPTTLYYVTRWTPHHNIIEVAFLPATLAATQAEVQSVLSSHPGF